jgi:hypothetical protein
MAIKDSQIFVALLKRDRETSKHFDQVCTREKASVFKAEYEGLKPPVWQTVKNEVAKSKALIFLVGPEMLETKKKGGADWSQINGLIGYMSGLAVAAGLDIWVLCDNKVSINFPVPYINNYSIGIETKPNGYEAKILRGYAEGARFEFGYSSSRRFFCPNKLCGGQYNLHNVLQKGEQIVCPMCLRVLSFPNGWQLQA